MRQFWWSVLYLAAVGILSNVAARWLPRDFRPDAFPFRPYGFEKQGKFYEKFGIRKWKNKVPDMSKHLGFLMRKTVTAKTDRKATQLLVQETCVAELVHICLIALSLLILLYWRTPGAAAFLLVYNLLGNLPFIMIQRYNRPRLQRLAEKQSGTEG